LQRWLGEQGTANISTRMRGWYGPPIAVAGVPGNVYACGDGDFVGECRGGYEATAEDYLRELAIKTRRAIRRVSQRRSTLMMPGFASLADLISEGNGGKKQTLAFANKNSVALQGNMSSSWRNASGVPGSPPAGAGGAAAPGGTVYNSASVGAIAFQNPPSGDLSFVGRTVFYANNGAGGGQQMTGLLHDRLFAVAKTMSSTATEAVTGVPTRYQSTTPGAADYATGNFLYVEATGTESAAHNWTVCQYTDQDGNTGASFPSFAGVNTQITGRPDFGGGQGSQAWFVPLAAGDTGVLALTQMQCDTSITGGADFTLCHPLAWMTALVLNDPGAFNGFIGIADGIKSSFNLARVFDDACLAIMGMANTNGAGIMSGYVEVISG
jgi:hypothetical protein